MLEGLLSLWKTVGVRVHFGELVQLDAYERMSDVVFRLLELVDIEFSVESTLLFLKRYGLFKISQQNLKETCTLK